MFTYYWRPDLKKIYRVSTNSRYSEHLNRKNTFEYSGLTLQNINSFPDLFIKLT